MKGVEIFVGTFDDSESFSEIRLELIVEAVSMLEGGVGRMSENYLLSRVKADVKLNQPPEKSVG